jgi:signal transduction histidine kinase
MAGTDFLRALDVQRRGRAFLGRSAASVVHRRAILAPASAVVGVLVWVLAIAIAAAGAPADQAFGRGLLELLVVGVPLAAGLYALRAPVDKRFGIGLLVTAFAWSVTALAEASASVPYTIGRLATWLVPPSVYFLLLVFPEGRLGGRLERVLFASIIAMAVVLFVGSAFFVEAYPLHTPWATCVTNCPANALFLLDDEPAVMGAVILPLREWLLCALLVGLVIAMVRRWRAASALRRRMIGPVVAMGMTMAVCQIAFYATRQADASATVVETLGAVWGVCIVGVAGAFLYALFRRRLRLAEVLARLGEAIRDRADGPRLRDALTAALGDPTLEVVTRDQDSNRWRDSAGAEVPKPSTTAPSGRTVTSLSGDEGAPAVMLIHDVALCDDAELLAAVGSLVLAGRRYERAVAGLDGATAELEESRRRIAETAHLERARIERDLHDGAQQRLIVLRIKLSLAEQTLHEDPEAGAEAVHELGIEAERALDDLRAHTGSPFPSVVRREGLGAALRALARDAPLPVHVMATDLTRRPFDIESAVYFTCVEALQNATKHAPTATGVWVDLSEDQGVRFEVCDDGPGFTPDDHPGGLRNMLDRIDAVGGELTIDTAPGRGTRIVGVVPVAQEAAPPAAVADAADPPVRADAAALPELMIYERVLPAGTGAVRQVRRELDDVLQWCGVAGAERTDVALTVSEAITNVAQHAYGDRSPGPLYVAAALRGHTLAVSVIDDGCGMRVRPAGPGVGLGLALMARLTDALEIVSDAPEPGTAVHATFENVRRPRTTPSRSSEDAAMLARGALLHDYVRVLAAVHQELRHDTEAVLAEAQQALSRCRRRRSSVRAP